MDQMFQTPQSSPEQLPQPVGPSETLPTVVDHEKLGTPETAEQNLGAPALGVQQASDAVAVVATQVALPVALPNDPQALPLPSDPQADEDVIEVDEQGRPPVCVSLPRRLAGHQSADAERGCRCSFQATRWPAWSGRKIARGLQ